MYSKVLCHLWIVFDTHKLNFREFLFEDHLPSMDDDGRFGKIWEDDGRRWKMTYGHWKMYSKVLCHLWIVFDTHELSFCEFLFEDHLPSMEDDGRRWKMMEDDGK